jgi:hypothetical protein
MKTSMKTAMLALSAAMFALTLGLSGCGDDSADLADLKPPNHDLAVFVPHDLLQPDVDAGDTD